MVSQIEALTNGLLPLTQKIISHPLYEEISSMDNLKCFMSEHVFAVWDFMCLLKALHSKIVTTQAPWYPPKDALSANLITSILAEEEGDLNEHGEYESHYDIYLAAMKQVGSDTQPIHKLLMLLRNGKTIEEAIAFMPILPSTKEFVLTTFGFFDRPAHEIAAAFVYGREGITAGMFQPIMVVLGQQSDSVRARYSSLIYYLQRHIELDGDTHFPKALEMLSRLVGDNERRYQEAEAAATRALKARINFLDGIYASLNTLTCQVKESCG